MRLKDVKNELSKLSNGDPSHDREVILSLIKAYSDERDNKQIMLFLGGELYRISSPQEKKDMEGIAETYDLGTEAVLAEVKHNIEANNEKEAYGLITACIALIESKQEYINTEDSEYHCFREPADEAIYLYQCSVNRKMLPMDKDYCEAYWLYALCLLKRNNNTSALNALKQALEYNPMNMKCRIKLLDLLKNSSDFVEEYNKTVKLVYHPEDIKELYSIGCCYLESAGNKNLSAFKTLKEKFDTNRTIEEFEDSPLNTAPDKEVLGILYALGTNHKKAGNLEIGDYYLTLLYNLTYDQDVYQQIDSDNRNRIIKVH